MVSDTTIKVCREGFAEILKSDSELQGRTWCVLDPYEGRGKNLHFTIVDKATGFGTPVFFAAPTIPILDIETVKAVLAKIMDGLKIAVNKYKNEGKPVDYKANPLKMGDSSSIPDSVEEFANSTVEFYSWSKIIVK